MKKIIGVFTAIALGSIMFAGPFGDLAKTIGKTSSAPVSDVLEGTIPEGKELGVYLWKMDKDQLKNEDSKVTYSDYELTKSSFLENKFEITQKIIFKFGLGLQCQESAFDISGENGSYKISITKMVTYNVDKNGEATSNPLDNSSKSQSTCLKDFGESFASYLSNMSDEEYGQLYDDCFYSLQVQNRIGFGAANRLKGKRWFEKHPMIGRQVEYKATFKNVSETRKSPKSLDIIWEYKNLMGYTETPKKSLTVECVVDGIVLVLFTDNEDFIDFEKGQECTIKGKVINAAYSSSAEPYNLRALVIED